MKKFMFAAIAAMVMVSGATVSTGTTSELSIIILLDANTLLTETITIAAIAANINFFIIVYFLNCYYLMLLSFLLTFFVDSLSNPLFIVTICVPKRNEKIICVDYQTFMFFLYQE